MSGVSSLGQIRDSFKKALELDPSNFRAAGSLVTFYLEVPRLLGGSPSKAKDVITELNKVQPLAANLLQARFDLKDDNPEKARTGAMSVHVSGPPALIELQNEILLQIAQSYVAEKNGLRLKNLS